MLTISLIILILKAKQKGKSIKFPVFSSNRLGRVALLVLFGALPYPIFAQQFNIVGNAFQNDTSCFTITTDSQGESSAIWNTVPINLAHNFDLKFNIFLGNYNPNSPDPSGTCGPGADGICFVLQNSNTGVAETGGGIGYEGFPGQSLAVEFDTYQNLWDPAYSHIAIEYDGQTEHGYDNGTLAGPVQMSNSETYTTDGNWHQTEIVWNTATDSMTVFFDNVYRTGYNFNSMGGLFNGIFQGLDSNIYWGFTGSTGSYCNNAMVCMQSLNLGNPPSASFQSSKLFFCANDCISFADKSANSPTSWLWTFEGGTPSISSEQNPSLVCYATAGNYNVQLIASNSAGSDTLTFANYITVNPSPTPTITPNGTSTFCEGNSVTLSASTANSYLWSNGATTQSIIVTASGLDSVTVTTNGCSGTSTPTIIIVNPLPQPSIIQAHDTLYCTTSSTYNSYQWYAGNALISGASDTFLVISQSGNYNIEVANTQGCLSAAGIDALIGVNTGVNNYTSDNFISISPNPVTNQLTIHTSSLQNEPVMVSVLNTLGQIALSSSLSFDAGRGEALDVTNLPAGIYFLCLESKSGNAVKKFVKE